jgi:uncharacterized DUF497 family protein
MILVSQLRWDDWNRAHIAEHGITPEQVEALCQGPYIIRQGYKGRLMLIGPDDAGRILAAVLDPEGQDTYYTVSARPASRRERRIYQQEKGGGTT